MEDHLRTLKMLADGINPLTGEKLPEDILYQNVKVVRALMHAISIVEKHGAKPVNAGRKWGLEETRSLEKEYHTSLTIAEIAEKHGRTEYAILKKLEELGKIKYQPGGYDIK